MTIKRSLLVAALLVGLAGAAYLSKEVEPPGVKMTTAAERFLVGLDAKQKAKTVFDFDSPERINWHFIPLQTKDRKSTRKGLPLEEMTAAQKDLAKELVRTGTSRDGYDKAVTIMSLEGILAELEKGGAMVRNPQWYFFTVFGTPSKTGKWGWRVEGHHLSLNFVVDHGKIVAATPAFFGANPAHVMDGKRKGLRTLPQSEDLARQLFASLDRDQKAVALHKQFPEIEQGKAAPDVGPPVGLAAGKMTEKQRGALHKLLEAYAGRMPPDVGNPWLLRAREAGLDKIHFAFSQDSSKPGKPYTYRVQGPTLVIEFLNVQPDSAGNPANHIHSAWRDANGDFGIPRR